VETKEQLASLTAEGCDEFQGFLFSRPQPAAEIQRMLGELAPRSAAVA
jgi:EAL domain-containing protein (putative c-di-GMP-specific phosphodiesterase class I)